MKRSALILVAAATLGGCAITQNVSPVTRVADGELCLVKNSEVVQDGFHPALVGVLQKKGFGVKELPDLAPVTSCPLLMTYEAIYRWDMAIYLARADLSVYEEGKRTGRAEYDSLSGGANMNKFIRTEPKLQELVDQLFPARR